MAQIAIAIMKRMQLSLSRRRVQNLIMGSSEDEVFSRTSTLSPRTDGVHSRCGDIATIQFGQKQLEDFHFAEAYPGG